MVIVLGSNMHQKIIRRLAKRQLKINHPYWNAMRKKEKKKVIKQIMDEVTNDYDFSQTLNVPIEELTGIEDQVVSRGIRTIEEMGRYIKNFYSDDLFGIDQRRPPFPEIVDKELQFIDETGHSFPLVSIVGAANHLSICSVHCCEKPLYKMGAMGYFYYSVHFVIFNELCGNCVQVDKTGSE